MCLGNRADLGANNETLSSRNTSAIQYCGSTLPKKQFCDSTLPKKQAFIRVSKKLVHNRSALVEPTNGWFHGGLLDLSNAHVGKQAQAGHSVMTKLS